MRVKKFLRILKDIQKQEIDIIINKSHDYANKENIFSNFEIVSKIVGCNPEIVFLTMIGIKIARLSELLTNKKVPKNEAIEDTILDMRNYLGLLYGFLKNNKKGEKNEKS